MRSFDHHRRHAPVALTVLDVRLMRGQACKEVEITVNNESVVGVAADDETGCQLVQMRGLVILNSDVGPVACFKRARHKSYR